MLIKLALIALAINLFLKAHRLLDQEQSQKETKGKEEAPQSKWGMYILLAMWLPLLAADARWFHLLPEKWGISFFAFFVTALYTFVCGFDQLTEEHKPKLRTFLAKAIWLPLLAIDAKWLHLLYTGKWQGFYTVILVLVIIVATFFVGRAGDQGILKLKFWYQRHWALKGNKFLWVFWPPVILTGVFLGLLLWDPIVNFLK